MARGQPLAERFWSRIEKTEGCWFWVGARTSNGYGMLYDHSRRRQIGVHRLSWEFAHGAIPEGLQIDHLCRVKNCVNPAHIEPVTALENQLRYWRSGDAHHYRWNQTHCKRGHEFTPKNTRIYRGRRFCRACATELTRIRRADIKEQARHPTPS